MRVVIAESYTYMPVVNYVRKSRAASLVVNIAYPTKSNALEKFKDMSER